MPFYAEFAELAAPTPPTSTSKLILPPQPQIASLVQSQGGLSAFLYSFLYSTHKRHAVLTPLR